MRRHGEQVVITHAGPAGPAEVARHQETTPGSPRIDDAHYPPSPPGALARVPKARTSAEAAFLAIGDGLWLAEAAILVAIEVTRRRRHSGPMTTLVLVLRRQRGRMHLDAPEWAVERLGAPRVQ